MATETRTYRGIRFYRYPDSDRPSDRRYFRPGVADAQRGVEALHREVWKHEVGPIPDGFQVHHLDGDPANNDVENLAIMTQAAHLALHVSSPEWQARFRSPEHLARLEAIRPKAAAWHASEEGHDWHVRHGHESWEGREPVRAVCEWCGRVYESRLPKRFCSNNCKSAARRASGVDDVTRTCAWCGGEFAVNKYSKAVTCSPSCRAKRRAVTSRV